MTRIGPHAAGAVGASSEPGYDPTGRHGRPPGEDDIGRPAGERRDALGGDLREGARHAGTQQREALSRDAFEQSLKRAQVQADTGTAAQPGEEGQAALGSRAHGELEEGGRREAHDDHPVAEADAGTLRLLALAERPPGFALMPAVPSADAAPAGTEQALRVEAVAQRVEEAVRAELYATPGRPIALKLDLGGLVPGLLAVTVAMTPDGIDVTLARAPGEAPAELVQAAQALAERLQTRFAKRLVRVFDAPDASEAPRAPMAGATGRVTERPA